MLVNDLKPKLQVFLEALQQHRELYSSSLDSLRLNVRRNTGELQGQIAKLNRMLGELRPFIERFADSTIMRLPAAAGGGVTDFFSAAVSNNMPLLKGPSLDQAIATTNEVLGHLDRHTDDDDVPEDASRPIRPGINIEPLIRAYLPHLHQMVQISCEQLYQDGHYGSAILNSATAITQLLRNRTGLIEDGDTLITKTFSTTAPILKLNTLVTETERNEQVGFLMMLQGFNKMVRNVYVHTHNRQEDPKKAFEIIVTASYLCQKIDEAERIPAQQG